MSREIIAILRGVKPDEVVGICENILEAGIDRICHSSRYLDRHTIVSTGHESGFY